MKLSRRPAVLVVLTVLLGGLLLAPWGAGSGQETKKRKQPAPPKVYNSGIVWEEPKAIDPGSPTRAPADAVVLFDGKSLDAWKGGERWKIENGEAISGGAMFSKQGFGDCQLHLEWASPREIRGKGQGRGNHGVKLMSRYEVQILDSFANTTYLDGMCGAVYKQRPPLVNASRRPGEWQTYDILFTAPRFDSAGTLVKPAYITVLHNGVLVHNHVAILGTTAYDRPPRYTAHPDRLPIMLAHHGQPVRFRNIWVREIQELDGKRKDNPR
ncbi:MAG: DUF1080 domain-containing protein [Gemmataceae bacterium]|nr:DUF1080 domain-containing protein [Gemmataceae bacterium]